MAEFKIHLAPSAFVVATTGDVSVTATDQAAAWLSEICAGGFEPVTVIARGTDARMTLSGGAEGTPLVLRKVAT